MAWIRTAASLFSHACAVGRPAMTMASSAWTLETRGGVGASGLGVLSASALSKWHGLCAGAGWRVDQTRGMKHVSALKFRCPHCRLGRKGKILYVRCDENPRHKQRQGGVEACKFGSRHKKRFRLPKANRGTG
ncbi:hypothetical protein FVE85_8497 [Porphyridium purpureum]|uniref:Ribosomal protein n=1 Tax=Porphyridium purpureum TaxID=35688 RepID=A0A5J4YLJ9_PORPP|nr:hypothetical protein FVE85_8497 [Porphyridium purpureum]|eukprot:POR5894..scf244_11